MTGFPIGRCRNPECGAEVRHDPDAGLQAAIGLYYMNDDGSLLCPNCAEEELERYREEQRAKPHFRKIANNNPNGGGFFNYCGKCYEHWPCTAERERRELARKKR